MTLNTDGKVRAHAVPGYASQPGPTQWCLGSHTLPREETPQQPRYPAHMRSRRAEPGEPKPKPVYLLRLTAGELLVLWQRLHDYSSFNGPFLSAMQKIDEAAELMTDDHGISREDRE